MKFILNESAKKYILYEAGGNGQATETSQENQFGVTTTSDTSWDELFQKAQGNAADLQAFWANYFTQEWPNPEKRTKLQKLGEALLIELQTFGFSTKVNPFLAFIVNNYIETNNIKNISAEQYSELHNHYKSPITPEILKIKGKGDLNESELNSAIYKLIISDRLYANSPNIVGDYLDAAKLLVTNKDTTVTKLAEACKAEGLTGDEISIVDLFYILYNQDNILYESLAELVEKNKGKNIAHEIINLRPVNQVFQLIQNIIGATLKKKQTADDAAVTKKLEEAGVLGDNKKLSDLAKYLIIHTAESEKEVNDYKTYCDKLVDETDGWTTKIEDWEHIDLTSILSAATKLLELDINASTIKTPVLYTILSKMNPTK